MKIAIAPALYVLKSHEYEAVANLALADLPDHVTIVLPENWEDLCSSYELLGWLLRRNVVVAPPSKKAEYLRISENILSGYDSDDVVKTKRQLYIFILDYQDAHRLYVGAKSRIGTFLISIDKISISVINVNPYEVPMSEYFDSLRPKLDQLKHGYAQRTVGGKMISSFSAYDKNNEEYAKFLLQQAFDDHDGDVDDRTYLYTYDSKNRTFVEFRPSRNNAYHGMDIDLNRAKIQAPDIVRKYHK